MITGGPFKGGHESSTPRSLIDIYPTLLDAAGIKPLANQTFDGVSLIGPGLINSNVTRDIQYVTDGMRF